VSRLPIGASDWDDTLVDAKTQEWLPGAEHALGVLVGRCRRLVIHTCHANWPEGRASVEAKLDTVLAGPARAQVSVEGKPNADFYIGNNYFAFAGDWSATLEAVGL
jgi:hypothetical protein